MDVSTNQQHIISERDNVGDEASHKLSQAIASSIDQKSERSGSAIIAKDDKAGDATKQGKQPEILGFLPPYMKSDLAPEDTPGKAATKKLTDLPGGFWLPVGSDGIREIYDAKNRQEQPGEKARVEGEPASGNAEVNKAYEFSGIVRDFYLTEFGRDSIDGKGMPLVSTVNFGLHFEDAFWDGKEMTYGDPGEDSVYKTFLLLDLAGHEITHGVTQYESNLQIGGQPGALNESISDVFGELIKQYSLHQTADQADWLVAKGIFKDGINGRALRDMLHPGTAYDDPNVGKDLQPADMKHFVYAWDQDDHGAIHKNSGIPNRAFALFATTVGGYAWKDPGHIWYAARKAAGSTPDFAQFAQCTIDAAIKLGHAEEVPALKKAWETVGVKPSAQG